MRRNRRATRVPNGFDVTTFCQVRVNGETVAHRRSHVEAVVAFDPFQTLPVGWFRARLGTFGRTVTTGNGP